MERLTKKAYAKINLALDVLGKRPDGYHELRMIMQTVGVCDELTFTKRDDDEIRIVVTTDDRDGSVPGARNNSAGMMQDKFKEGAVDHSAQDRFTMSAAGHSAQEIPCDEHNLIFRAAKAVAERHGSCGGVDVTLVKRIPVAAGMAGGSSDAAATIRALDELYDLHMDQKTMSEIAVTIGADVPYCLFGGTMLCEGIGEILTPLPPAPQSRLVIVKPDISVSTAFVYGNLNAAGLKWHPDVDGMVRAIKGQDVQGLWQRIGNVLETVTIPAHPEVEQIKNTLIRCGAERALMSGSGPSVFAVFEDEQRQREAYETVRNMNGIEQVFMTELIADIQT